MYLSTIKLVAADMDGTLLNGRHELDAGFYPVFNQMKSAGILFAAASGRQYYNLVNRFLPIHDEIIFIAENGSYVVYQEEELLIQAMELQTTRDLLAEARKIPGTHAILCGKKGAYVESELPEFIRNVEMYYDRYQVVDDLMKVEDDQFLKIAICDLMGSEVNSYPFFKTWQDQLQVKVSGQLWLDLSHKLANKGRALEVVQKKLGVSFDQTIVFGDYLNDLEMMQQASYSYAMDNAHPEIKKVARFGTKSNDENGVLIVLEEMLRNVGS